MPDNKGKTDWSDEIQESVEKAAEFLKEPSSKKALTEFFMDIYRKMESENVARFKARVENERKVDSERISEFHQPSNIEPLVHENLGMHETERAFARGITLTKKNLIRSVEDRVEEINRLLAGIGGFSSQLKSCFARSTVVFLEQEDPKHSFRERLIFSIQLPNFELKRPIRNGSGKAEGKQRDSAEGRTPVQATWDDAINALAKIIESSGLKPKYVKNDRNYGHFVMKQDLRSNANLPDEYFSMTLDYNTTERVQEMCGAFNKVVSNYEKQIQKLTKSVGSYSQDSFSGRYLRKKKRLTSLVLERDYFLATVPDPNHLEEGLLFLIEVCTHKDYHIVKDRMQSIMTKFILHLSKIAAEEAEIDPDLEYELWKTGNKTKSVQNGATKKTEDWSEGLSAKDIESVPEYVVETSAIKPAVRDEEPKLTTAEESEGDKKKAA